MSIMIFHHISSISFAEVEAERWQARGMTRRGARRPTHFIEPIAVILTTTFCVRLLPSINKNASRQKNAMAR